MNDIALFKYESMQWSCTFPSMGNLKLENENNFDCKIIVPIWANESQEIQSFEAIPVNMIFHCKMLYGKECFESFDSNIICPAIDVHFKRRVAQEPL